MSMAEEVAIKVIIADKKRKTALPTSNSAISSRSLLLQQW